MSTRLVSWLAAFSLLAALLISKTAPAQSSNLSQDKIAARLSYQRTYLTDWETPDDSPRICFALYQSGRYRISRLGKNGPENLEGKLSDAEIARLTRMLMKLGSRTDGGIIQQGSESFAAEVLQDYRKVHYVWIDPDHKRPFPEAAERIVDWLQDFKAPDSYPFTLRELSNEPICPPASEKPVQPTVASAIPSGTSCGKK